LSLGSRRFLLSFSLPSPSRFSLHSLWDLFCFSVWLLCRLTLIVPRRFSLY
jgi:hypothetical protein